MIRKCTNLAIVVEVRKQLHSTELPADTATLEQEQVI
jgi:hypothetical protein